MNRAERVTVDHDGVGVEAWRDEPVAIALLAAGRTRLSRSAKYHRPRGASCLRGNCEGCLVRVDGVPNVMACQARAAPGMKVVSQNAFPSAGLDVLRVTDWFFPKHMDHHHFMVGLGSAVNRTMQVFARRMSGLGALPDREGGPRSVTEHPVDVLVVGAGPSGAACALRLAAGGLSVLCVDEERAPGGVTRDDPAVVPDAVAWPDGVRFMAGASAVAAYDDVTLVLCDGAVHRVKARARVFATGCHELVGTFAQNDLPGVMTARAFGRALCHGVLAGDPVVMVGDGPCAAGIARALDALGVSLRHLPTATVTAAHGGRAVTAATVRTADGRDETHDCEALVIAGDHASAYELPGQCGAAVSWRASRRCFAPDSDDDGATKSPGVFVCGSLRLGTVSTAERRDDGVRVAERVLREVSP